MSTKPIIGSRPFTDAAISIHASFATAWSVFHRKIAEAAEGKIFQLAMKFFVILWVLLIFFFPIRHSTAAGGGSEGPPMLDIQKTGERLTAHLHALTVAIGERSVRFPENLEKTVAYIESFYREIDMAAEIERYDYGHLSVANVVAEIAGGPNPSRCYLVGAHYDSVSGTVGADDNASAVAVQLETARNLKALMDRDKLDIAVKFISFALEEPPVYGTRYMGSRVYAKKARAGNESIDGMICLEMVGYACDETGCQHFPFPLGFLGYPQEGNFIGIVGNFKSVGFTRALVSAFQKNRDLPVVKLTVPLNGWILPSVRLSDHASFWDKGFKAVMITDSAFYRNPNYHLASDTMETLDTRFMAELVESLILFFGSHRE